MSLSAKYAATPSLDLPPVVSDAETAAADADIPFYSARVELSNARTAALCEALNKVGSDAAAKPPIARYFARYYADDAQLLKRFPSHSNFIRNMDYQTHLLQRAIQPSYLRKVCSGG